jgi:hypothetical protein
MAQMHYVIRRYGHISSIGGCANRDFSQFILALRSVAPLRSHVLAVNGETASAWNCINLYSFDEFCCEPSLAQEP